MTQIQYKQVRLGDIVDLNTPFYKTHPESVTPSWVAVVFYTGVALTFGANPDDLAWVTTDTEVLDPSPL